MTKLEGIKQRLLGDAIWIKSHGSSRTSDFAQRFDDRALLLEVVDALSNHFYELDGNKLKEQQRAMKALAKLDEEEHHE